MHETSLGQCDEEAETIDVEAARQEGWVLSDCSPDEHGRKRVQIQKLDADPRPRFREDREAWVRVVERARAGSRLHRRALDLIDPRERMAIAASCGPW